VIRVGRSPQSESGSSLSVLVLAAIYRNDGVVGIRVRTSILGNFFDTSGAQSLPLDNRQCGVMETKGIWHPYQDSYPSVPRCVRYLGCFSICKLGVFPAHTSNILIENIIFLDHIVYYLLRIFVDDQHLPLLEDQQIIRFD
jgi:hypothetical protein